MADLTLVDFRERVRNWSNRSDLSDSLLNDFINIALARANRILRIPVLEGVVTLDIVDGKSQLPRDYLEAKELKVTTNNVSVTLERKDIHFVDEVSSKSQGIPLYFSRKSNEFFYAPSPTSVTTAELYYYVVLSSLVNDTDTNWFITDAPEMILYGALSELFLYVKNPTAAGQWEAKFRAAMDEVQSMANQADWSGDTLSITAMS